MSLVTFKTETGSRVGLAALATLLLVLFAGGARAQLISSFECGGVGANPSCDGWVTVAGVPSINIGVLLPCPGLPTLGARYCQLPGPGGPSTPPFPGVGNPSAYPYTGGFTEMSRTFTALYADLEIDYNWSAAPGAPSWFEILLVDPTTNAVLDTFAQGDAMTTPLPAPGCGASFGSPPPNSTGLQTATATVPPSHVGQSIKVVVVAGENGTVFIPPIAFVNVDNLRYAPLQPLYPGNGADCDIEVSINGVPQVGFSDQGRHDLFAGDDLTLRFYSPNGSLDDRGLALVYTLFPSGNPPTPIPLLPPNPADVWIDPSNAVVVIDSLSPPTSIFVPQLYPGGYIYGPYLAPLGLSGTSAMLQMFVDAPGFNLVNIGVSNGEELRFN